MSVEQLPVDPIVLQQMQVSALQNIALILIRIADALETAPAEPPGATLQAVAPGKRG